MEPEPLQCWSFEQPIPHHRNPNNNSNSSNGPHSKSRHSLNDLSEKWNKVVNGDFSRYDDDCSDAIWGFVLHTMRRGWTDDEIRPYILEPQYKLSRHCQSKNNPRAEADRQLTRARANIASNYRTNQYGEIIQTDLRNIKLALNKHEIRFFHNEFSYRIAHSQNCGKKELVDDAVLEHLMDQIDQKENFWPNQRAFHRAAIAISEEHKYHPIRETLNILQDRWMRSNKPIHLTRHWLNHLAGADDDPLIQQFAMLTLVAAVRRIRRPGCKFDEMLVLQSAQGTNKSSALELLSLNSEWFSDNFPLHERNNQRVQESLQGKWIVECSELDGYEKADDEHFKAMLSRQTDSVRPAYGRLIKDAPRQCIFIGTTNSIHFLRETCNRRIWPVIIKEFDLDALKAILHDLWGEAAHLESTGMSIRLDQTLWPAAAEQQEKHRLPDPWVSVLYAHLNNKTGFIQEVGAWDLLGVPPAQRRPSHNRRLYKVMKELGWHPIQHQFGSGFLKDTLDNYISVDVVDGVLPRTFRATQTTMPDALEEDIDIPNF